MKRPMPGDNGGSNDAPFNDEGFQKEFPLLWEHLVTNCYDDGSSRKTSTLLIFIEGTVLRMCLNDRDNNRSSFTTSETFADCLTELEARLAKKTMEWKRKQSYGSSGAVTPF